MLSFSALCFLTLSLHSTVTLILVSGEVLFEDGYTVTTVIDGDKVKANPQLILPRYGSSEFVLLDSAASIFYTVSVLSPQENVIKKLTGNGVAGYMDGDLGSASFNKPKNFVVDFQGNIYVADQNNHVIRKVSSSGVTTIAGGYTQKTGRADGPAQNATFSDDFELAFAPQQCLLLISDHGSRLVRQITLKPENCRQSSESVLGSTFAWGLGVVLSCIVGLTIGFFIRPYVFLQGGQDLHLCKETWNHFLINLGRRVQTCCFDIKSAVVNSSLSLVLRKLVMLTLSHLALTFRFRVVKPVSILDVDSMGNSHAPKSEMVMDQLRDLITFDEALQLSDNVADMIDRVDGADVSPGSSDKIDDLIQDNVMDFAQLAMKPSQVESLVGGIGLVKRRSK